MKRAILVDGNNLLFRSYYATAYNGNLMKNSKGFPTNAIFGFINMINKIILEEKPEEVQKAEKPKVDTSHLVVPPLPGERQGFTVGMKVPKNHDQSLIYTSPMMWKKK